MPEGRISLSSLTIGDLKKLTAEGHQAIIDGDKKVIVIEKTGLDEGVGGPEEGGTWRELENCPS
jgi:hypothetical protein